MLNKSLFLLLILAISLVSGLYYRYATLTIPTEISKSDHTMMNVDAMRFTFKAAILLQRGQAALEMAVRMKDKDKLDDAVEYFEAAKGFLYTNFIDNKKLISEIEPYFKKISTTIEKKGLTLSTADLNNIYHDTDIIRKNLGFREKEFWIDLQHKYFKFQTNEYTIQNLYKSIAFFILLLLFVFLWMLLKQKKLHQTILENEKELSELAYFDPLTKVPNRRCIEKEVKNSIEYAKRKNSDFYLALIDIDNFKNINDLHGHDSGDAVLVECVKRIKKSIRTIDTIGRFGGDEFIIIFKDISVVNDLTTIIERIIDSFNEPVYSKNLEHYTNVSIGIVHYPTDAKTASELIKFADIAMYHSKALGKARYNFFESSYGEIIKRQYHLEPQIKEALSTGQFELYYQPQVDVVTAQTVGAEALVRWNHPTKGLIGPAEFIDIIENGYLVKEFGAWVITQAYHQQKRWMEKNINLDISVNLSVKHILSQNFDQDIMMLVSHLGMDLEKFHFEITEYSIMEHSQKSSDVLNHLASRGFRFSLDDFGTGYSSITQLNNLKIDSLKIDKSFVDDISENKDQNTIIDAIVNMSKALGLKIIVEGVETQTQYNYIKDLGCDMVQGYYFSKPLSAEKFETYMAGSTKAMEY